MVFLLVAIQKRNSAFSPLPAHNTDGKVTYLTRFPIRDSRYLRAESCPRSLLYPLVNRPSACLVGLHSTSQDSHIKLWTQLPG